MRKVILSRKGFDSTTKEICGVKVKVSGGKPSAFVPGGEMVSFPIPEIPEKHEVVDSDLVGYEGICAEGMSLRARMEMLYGGVFASQWERCHHDPDLRRGIFGQSGGPQTILKRGEVDVGDLFLFFGWFQEAKWNGGVLRPCSPQRKVHALFGYLQIGEILPATVAAQKYPHWRDHPHMTPVRLERDKKPDARRPNTVYIAAKHLDIPGMGDCPGFGIFRHALGLELTHSGEKSPSFWALPEFFEGESYPNCVRRISEGARKGLFSTVGQWQECVINATPEIRKWALERIRIGMRAD